MSGVMAEAEYLAMMFHCYYEELAPGFGYQTREESAVSWNEVPTQNKQLMIAVAEKLLDGHVLIIEKEGENTWDSLERGLIEHEPDQTYGAADG